MSHAKFSWDPIAVPPIKTSYRTIATMIPAPGTKELLQKLNQYESRSMQGQLPLVWDKAKDFSIYDPQGNRWIDFTSTIFVTNTGHANDRVKTAVQKALEAPLLHSYAYAHEQRVEYLKKLIDFSGSPFEKAFLLSAGTEATEAALKLMRLQGLKNKKRRLGIICIEGNWHGRTMGAQMMSSNQAQKEWIGFQDPNIHHIPFPYLWSYNDEQALESLNNSLDKLEQSGISLKQDICGFMLETFQGWCAGFYPEAYVKAIKKVCDENELLLCFDEMQAGFARTGKVFGYQHYDVKPDLICVGKGMASGFPLSGVMGSKEVMDLPGEGDMSSTHSANPISCAAGMATLDEIIESDLVKQSARKGRVLHKALNELAMKFPEFIRCISGRGMIAAIITQDSMAYGPASELTTKIAIKCFQKGLLVVHTGRESIKIGPPLTIPDEALLEGVAVIEEAIVESLT